MASGHVRSGRLWVEGRITLRVGDEPRRRLDRPYAVIGRTEGVDVRLSGREVSGRHVYLHLDHRGLYALDLASRVGLRIDGRLASSGWLRAGQALEVAGRRLEIVELRVGGAPLPSGGRGGAEECLIDLTDGALARVSLHLASAPDQVWELNSELVVLGRSSACGVQIQGAHVARVHAVLVRTAAAAYVVDLSGWGLRCNGQTVRGAAELVDGDMLAVGATRFEVRIGPPGSLEQIDIERISNPIPPSAPALWRPAGDEPAVARLEPGPAPIVTDLTAQSLLRQAPEGVQASLAAWMAGMAQMIQGELARRREETRRELAGAIHRLRREQEEALQVHRGQVEALQRDLEGLREEVRRLGAPADSPPPLRLERAGPAAPAAGDEQSTAWLMDRVQRLGQTNRTGWLDLLGRLGADQNET